MTRRRRTRGDSLDLLLDTITNTFGGILFLAILVALLLRTGATTTSRSTIEPVSASERAMLEVRIEELSSAAEMLRRRIGERVAGRTDESRPQYERLDAETQALEEALEERARAAARTLDMQREAGECEGRIAELEIARDEGESRLRQATERRTAAREEAEELARAAARLDGPPRKRVLEQTAALPRLRPSGKQQFGIYVRFGRMFVMHVWQGGNRVGPNPEHFIVTGDSPPVARPRPAAGIPIEAETIEREFARLLRAHPRDRFVVALVVFDDSFDEFQTLKAAVVGAGYEYCPIPLSDGEPVMDSGGSGEAQ